MNHGRGRRVLRRARWICAAIFTALLVGCGFVADFGQKPAGCEPTRNGVEVCDGIDNNCNGVTDEGATCATTTQRLLLQATGHVLPHEPQF